MVATKQVIITKEHDASVETIIYYNDLKAYGKGFWSFHRKAKEQGTKYVRARPYDVFEVPETKNLIVRYEDLETGQLKKEEVELLVLSTGLLPSDRNERLAKVLEDPAGQARLLQGEGSVHGSAGDRCARESICAEERQGRSTFLNRSFRPRPQA